MMIFDLKNQPQHIATLAAWHHQEWSHLNPGGTLQTRITKMQYDYLSARSMPKMFIWVDQESVVGSAAIVSSDMDSKPELKPWLASVFVKPDCRELGIGAALVKQVMDYAREQGFAELFLFTPDKESFYQKLGWHRLAYESYHGEQVTVMRVDLID